MAAQSLIPGLIPDCSKIIESLRVLSQTSGVNKTKPQKGEKEIEKKRDTEAHGKLQAGRLTQNQTCMCVLAW